MHTGRALRLAYLIGTRASLDKGRCRCEATTIPGGRVGVVAHAYANFHRNVVECVPVCVDATVEIIPCDPLDRLSGV